MEENKVNVKKLTLIAVSALLFCVIVGALVFIFGKPTTRFPLKESHMFLKILTGKIRLISASRTGSSVLNSRQ